MEIQASRMRARLGPAGRADPAARAEPRPLGSAAHPPRLRRPAARRAAGRPARPLRAAGGDRGLSRAGAHRRGDRLGRIAALYEALARHAVPGRGAQPRGRGRDGLRPGRGPGAGRRAWPRVPALPNYHLLPSVRGDLLAKLGRRDEARAEFRRAAALTRNSPNGPSCCNARPSATHERRSAWGNPSHSRSIVDHYRSGIRQRPGTARGFVEKSIYFALGAHGSVNISSVADFEVLARG